jgi:hypothetical protein
MSRRKGKMSDEGKMSDQASDESPRDGRLDWMKEEWRPTTTRVRALPDPFFLPALTQLNK